MTVTSIEDKGRGRYIIYLNDAPAFILKASEIRDHGLSEGEELLPEVYDRILGEVLVKRAKSRTLHILDGQDKTEQELRDRLKKDLYPEEAIDAAVEAAKKGNYLNDERYASEYIYEKSGKKSRRQIAAFLRGKGIAQDIIDRALSEADEVMEETGNDPESELIERLIRKRCADPSCLDPVEEQKLIRFLISKGFEYHKISRVLSSVKEEGDMSPF